jgi:hypothetical protein
MTPQQFQERLRQPAWSKDVIVWLGSRETLDGLLHGLPQVTLDLLDLLPDDDALPAADAERKELLEARVDARVRDLRPADDQRAVLRVRSAPLLARYRAGLRPFFDWFAGARTMTVLEIDRPRPVALPDTVAGSLRLDTDEMVGYLRSHLRSADNLCSES